MTESKPSNKSTALPTQAELPAELRPHFLFEDTHLVVLSKPAGLLSQGESSGDLNLVDWLRQKWGRHYVGLVHRLDRNTSGIMIVAKRSKSASRLTDSLQKGDLQRTYLAWVVGRLEKPVRWAHSLVKDERTNVVRVVSQSGNEKVSKSQLAALTAIPQGKGSWEGHSLTLIEVRLETGRSHQIRVQCSAEGFPILGDRKYTKQAYIEGYPRPALHSWTLRFPHPMSGENLEFKAPLPSDMAEINVDRSS